MHKQLLLKAKSSYSHKYEPMYYIGYDNVLSYFISPNISFKTYDSGLKLYDPILYTIRGNNLGGNIKLHKYFPVFIIFDKTCISSITGKVNLEFKSLNFSISFLEKEEFFNSHLPKNIWKMINNQKKLCMLQ